MKTTPTASLRRSAATLTLLFAATLLAGCSSSDDEGASAESGTSSGATAESPFSSELSGPTEAESGDRLVLTLTNSGRLPDAYQVAVEPSGAATLERTEFRLGPGESVRFAVAVERTPFVVRLKSIGGGLPELVALTVGSAD